MKFFRSGPRCRLTRYQSRSRKRSRPHRLDAPKPGAGASHCYCRDGARPSGGARADPASGLQSLPFETNRLSTTSRSIRPLAARLENVADKFLGLRPWRRSLTGIAFATGAIPWLHGFLLSTTIRLPANLICEILRSAAQTAIFTSFITWERSLRLSPQRILPRFARHASP